MKLGPPLKGPDDGQGCKGLPAVSKVSKIEQITSLNVDSLIGSKLPKIESTCLTTIIGLEYI